MAQSIKEKFSSIKKSEISEQAANALEAFKKATKNFTDKDAVDKIQPKFDALYDKIKASKPQAIVGYKAPASGVPKSTPAKTQAVKSAASMLSITSRKRIAEAKKLRQQQGLSTKKSDIMKDADIPAIKIKGRRVSQGLSANKVGSKADNVGHVYYEYRDNRLDRRPSRFARLEKGGMMAKGGEAVPYIIWVSKDGEKREFFGNYKSKKAADMAMKKLWDSDNYHSVGNMSKSRYEKEGLYAKGGMMEKGGVNEDADMKTLKLYYYKTGGGAEYLMSKKMKGTKDVGDIKSKYVVRIDKAKIHGGELIIRDIEEEHDEMASGGMMKDGKELHRMYEKKKIRFDDGGEVMHSTFEVTLDSDNSKYSSMVGFNGEPLIYYGSNIGEVFEDVMNSIEDDMEIISIIKKED